MDIPAILKNVTENTKYIYQLKLRKTNLDLVAFVPFTTITFTKRHRDYNELSFEIADQIYVSHKHSLAPNPIWELVKAGLVIDLIIIADGKQLFEEYYSIQQPTEQGGENEHRRTFQCIPLHQLEFNKKKLRGMNDTRKLFDFDLQYYTREGADKEKDLRPYAFENPNKDSGVEGDYTTYNPKLYTCGGILNYIIEYILNKDTKIEEADIDEIPLGKNSADSYNKEYYYPTPSPQGVDYSDLQQYYRLKADGTGAKGLLTDDKYWKVSYYDPKLLTIWSQSLGVDENEYTPFSLYDFFYGNIEIGYTTRSALFGIDSGSSSDGGEIVPYLKNGLMTYWNCYHGQGLDAGINLENSDTTTASNWAVGEGQLSSLGETGWISEYHWNGSNTAGSDYIKMPVIGYDGFSAERAARDNYDIYVPCAFQSYDEIYKQARLLWDSWSMTDTDKEFLSSWGMENWDPVYGGCLTKLLEDLSEPNSSSWFYNVLTDPLTGSLLTQRADACIHQLQNYIEVVMTAVSATTITKTRTSPNTGETTTTSKNGYDTLSFKKMYDTLRKFYQRLVYFLWFPLYQKFSMYTGRMPYRNLNIDNSNLTEVFKTLEEEFMCRFEFDNVHKKIKIYAQDNEKYKADSQLVLSPYNYITDMSVTRQTDQIITRLYMEGKDGLWFTGANPTGQRYIDDFSYYKNTNYMSNDLIEKLDRYEQYLQQFNIKDGSTIIQFDYTIATDSNIPKTITFKAEYAIFYLHWKEVTKDYSEAVVLYNQLRTLEEEHNKAESIGDEIARNNVQIALRNSATATAQELAAYVGKIITSSGEIDWNRKDGRIPPFEKNFSLFKTKAEKFQKVMEYIKKGLTYQGVKEKTESGQTFLTLPHAVFNKNINTYIFDFEEDESESEYYNGIFLFDEKLLSALRHFIFEDDQNQSTISDEGTLLQYGQDYLKLLNIIPVETTINLVDILSVPAYYQDWKRINDVGKKCRILYPKLGFYLDKNTMLTLIEYTHTYSADSQDLSIKLSNANDITSLQYKLQVNTWVSAFKAYKTINKYQSAWDDYINNKDLMLWQGQNIRASSNPIVDSIGNKIIDGTGVILSKAVDNGIVKYADGLFCRSADSNYIIIEKQDFLAKTATAALLEAYLKDIEENTIIFIYDKTKGYTPGVLEG